VLVIRHVVPAVLAAILATACAGGGSPAPTPTTPAPTTDATPRATASASASPTATPVATATESSVPSVTPSVAPLGWAQLASAGPSTREDHTWTVDETGGSAWLFGGRDGDAVFDDLWRYDLGTDAWEAVEPPGERPAARFGHAAVWLPGTGLVVWSGQAGTTFFDDLWGFDPGSGAWRALPSSGDVPPARYGSCLAMGPDGRLWISHGFTADAGRFSDTRAWEPGTGAWTDETPSGDVPVVRCLHDCLWTPDGRLVVYAGQTTGVAAIGDLWTLEATAWSRAPEPEPTPRALYALAQAGEMAWVFGGGDSDRVPLGDLWRLSLGTLEWEPVEPGGDGPAARTGGTLIADEANDRLLLWGGRDTSTTFDDLWSVPLR
jgi:hypothetical protein